MGRISESKSEIRSTKSETNPKLEARRLAARGSFSTFEFGICFVLRISDFVLRFWCFARRGAAYRAARPVASPGRNFVTGRQRAGLLIWSRRCVRQGIWQRSGSVVGIEVCFQSLGG